MASALVKQPCIKCPKGAGITTCGGCQQWFCTRHFIEHRQELATQMDQIGQEHDLLQRDMIQENGEHPLLSRINDWEQTSIATIQEAAAQARIDLRKSINHTKNQVKTSLGQVTKQFESSRQSDDYTEMDLNKWIEQLAELRWMLETPSTIEIVDDDQTRPIIRRIQLKERQTTSKCSIVRKLSATCDRCSLEPGEALPIQTPSTTSKIISPGSAPRSESGR
jgi:hypothetical protein